MQVSARGRIGVGQSALRSVASLHEPNRVLVQEELEKLLDGASFFDEVAPKLESGELTCADVRELIRWGLMITEQDDYKELARLFNIVGNDPDCFVLFLREHNCHPGYTLYGNPIPKVNAEQIWLV